ncbi:MAG TPA: 16S rRNA (guanine(966)-N(2))-methyltransferase RsmD [Candidatus Udaeobacter sp.]|nr:16S rRNA (guanine(966)-N(2))-methyltransferase RsmD [Candidatus Udaeobacter sp.]
MRVIAGSAGGIRLAVPKRGVRPTMDRVKAAIFSSLGDAVVGARVLDLFAGSGALGIEALSRGASFVVFVESDRQSVALIEDNLARTKLKGQVRQQDVFDFLPHACDAEMFDIVFADPPYDKMQDGERFTEKLLANEVLPQLMEVDGIFVLEKRPDENLPETGHWRVTRQKSYGATEVLFLCVSRTIRGEQPRMNANQHEVLKCSKAASSRRTPKRLRREKSAVRNAQLNDPFHL